jgi:hypothetical protein
MKRLFTSAAGPRRKNKFTGGVVCGKDWVLQVAIAGFIQFYNKKAGKEFLPAFYFTLVTALLIYRSAHTIFQKSLFLTPGRPVLHSFGLAKFLFTICGVCGKDFESVFGPIVNPGVVCGKDYFRTFMRTCGLR